MLYSIPKEVTCVTKTLRNANFEAYLVGGCVRDLILNKAPKDWDVTTNATPDQILALFPDAFYENNFGTVGVVNKETEDERLKVIEVTPYRTESSYTDKRRPDEVTFSTKLEDDLKRRDFTINALALDENKGHIIDLYQGQEDLSRGIIQTVGKPEERFAEDALRMLRAVRLATELGFMINSDTISAITLHVKLLDHISKERIRDEFTRVIMSDRPMEGMVLIEKLGMLDYISPVLRETIGVSQDKKAHKYTVWEHLLRSLQHAADRKWPLEVRLAALFHDIAKPATKRPDGKGGSSFYGHEVLGAKVTRVTLQNLKFSKKVIEKVTTLVRWHMFFADTEQITLSAVRRMINNVGQENVWDLMNIRACDRIGTGRPKEDPYRLRKYHSMVEEALREPVSVGMLKIDGKRIMDVTHVTPGPAVGNILHTLLEEVLEDISKNTAEYLENRAVELAKLPPEELRRLGDAGKIKKQEEDDKELEEIRKKHSVK